jgi:hypothetical protein|tara:strand:- start:7681 stop:7920 length:240 start_codon:yes stop_codon:yes gene_type:complete
MFKVGDTISYGHVKDQDGKPVDGMILEIKEQIKISYHEDDVQTIVWVEPGHIEPSDTFDCTHENECGWCEGSGECIYED